MEILQLSLNQCLPIQFKFLQDLQVLQEFKDQMQLMDLNLFQDQQLFNHSHRMLSRNLNFKNFKPITKLKFK